MGLEWLEGRYMDTDLAVREVAELLRRQCEPELMRSWLEKIALGSAATEEVRGFFEHCARNLVQAWQVIGRSSKRPSARPAPSGRPRRHPGASDEDARTGRLSLGKR